MTNLSLFRNDDQEEAKKLLDAYDYNMANAIEHIANGGFDKASVYHQNMAHALGRLSQLKNEKKMLDEARELLSRIEDKKRKKVLEKLKP